MFIGDYKSSLISVDSNNDTISNKLISPISQNFLYYFEKYGTELNFFRILSKSLACLENGNVGAVDPNGQSE